MEERQHEVANTKLVDAISSSRHEAEKRKQQAEQQIAESLKRISDAMNQATQDRVEAIIDLSAKILNHSNQEGVKLTGEEAELVWQVLRKQQTRYVNGVDHVCEYKEGSFDCIVCGETF